MSSKVHLFFPFFPLPFIFVVAVAVVAVVVVSYLFLSCLLLLLLPFFSCCIVSDEMMSWGSMWWLCRYFLFSPASARSSCRSDGNGCSLHCLRIVGRLSDRRLMMEASFWLFFGVSVSTPTTHIFMFLLHMLALLCYIIKPSQQQNFCLRCFHLPLEQYYLYLYTMFLCSSKLALPMWRTPSTLLESKLRIFFHKKKKTLL